MNNNLWKYSLFIYFIMKNICNICQIIEKHKHEKWNGYIDAFFYL